MAKILLVEDDVNVQRTVRDWLDQEHHLVEVVADGRDAAHMLSVYGYDLLLLDWNVPGMSGTELLKELRSKKIMTPVLMLTARTEVPDKAEALDIGADDYLTKPFHFVELSARVRALLRRSSGQSSNVLSLGELELDPTNHQVRYKGADLVLMPKEFGLLEYMMRHPRQVFSADELLEKVWAADSEASSNTVRTYMYTLRKKLSGQSGECPIHTVYGVGYKLDPDA